MKAAGVIVSYDQNKMSSRNTLTITWASIIKLTTVRIQCGDSFFPETMSWKEGAVRQKESRESSN